MDAGINNSVNFGNRFKFPPDNVGWGDTIKNCFIPKRSNIEGNESEDLKKVTETRYLSERKVKTMMKVGFSLFVIALAIAVLAIISIFFPPAFLAALPVIALVATGGGALLFGLVALIFGVAAARTIKQVAADNALFNTVDLGVLEDSNITPPKL